MQTIQVTASNTATQLVRAGDPPTTINNADANNTIYLGDDPMVVPTDTLNTVQLTPGQYISVDGTKDLYGVCLQGQSAQAQLMPGATGISLSSTQQVAIANTTLATELASLIATGTIEGAPGGAPNLRSTKNLAFSLPAGWTIAPLNSFNFVNNLAVNQPGFEMELLVWTNSGVQPTVPFLQIIVEWFDSASGLAVEADFFMLACGTNSANQIVNYLSGPCKGDIMNVQAINMDSAQVMQLAYTVNVNSHVYTWSRLLQPTYAATAPNSFTNPNGTPGAGLLAIASPTILPSIVSSRLLAAWNGKVGINVDARAQANNISYTLQDPGSLYSGTSGGIFWSNDSPAGGSQFYNEAVMPNGPVLLTVTNRGSSGNVAPIVSVMKLEY